MPDSKLILACGVVLVATLLSGCGRDNSLPGHATASAAEVVPGKHQARSLPDRISLSTLPANTTQLFARLDTDDRAAVDAFYGEAGNVALDFGNRGELQWLQRHGYPMPSDALDAARQTDAELRGRLERGDTKAGYFLLDRLGSRSRGSYLAEGTQLAEQMLSSGSPYSGFAYYGYHRRIKGDWALALSGLLWASYQGDTRALDYYNQVSSTGGPFQEALAPGDVGVAYLLLLSEVHLTNPALLSRPLDTRLKYQ